MQKKAPNNANWIDQSPTHLVHRVAQCASDVFSDEVFQARVDKKDLTPRQVAVLSTVAQDEGLSQTAICVRTGIDRSTLADLVRRLKKKGFLERRRRQEDTRTYAVTLTEEGRRVLRTIEPLAKKVDEHILAAVPTKDRAPFLAALRSIVATLQPRE
jgi:MarR family transcriptional regulator, temperature-dependent positive regulator of motility